MMVSRRPQTVFLPALIGVMLASVACTADAQNNRAARQQAERQKQIQKKMQEIANNTPQLPTDPQLLVLHKEFITKAEKLAGEYERKKQYDRAREVYEALVRLVPKYKNAEEGLRRMMSNQLSDRKLTKVAAAGEWQDTGANIQKGMPIQFEVKGTWKVVYETDAEGIQIPNELKPRDGRIKLGTLIGVIATKPSDLKEEKPFIVKTGKEMIAERSGRLFLRMFDIDPMDNEGEIYVLTRSNFGK